MPKIDILQVNYLLNNRNLNTVKQILILAVTGCRPSARKMIPPGLTLIQSLPFADRVDFIAAEQSFYHDAKFGSDILFY